MYFTNSLYLELSRIEKSPIVISVVVFDHPG
jgi:hypothetical protein